VHLGRLIAETDAYASFALRRFHRGRGMQSASSLTYTILVPLIVAAFFIFSAFPTFQNAREQLKVAILANLVPSVGEEVCGYLNEFF
jgi:membrane protein